MSDENDLPVCLILGNGFDLAHGLPTNYEDFLKFLNKIQNKFIEDLKTDGTWEKYKWFAGKGYDKFRSGLAKDDSLSESKEKLKQYIRDSFMDCLSDCIKDGGAIDQFCRSVELEEYMLPLLYQIIGGKWAKYFDEISKNPIGKLWIDFEAQITKVVEAIEKLDEEQNIHASYSKNPMFPDISELINKNENIYKNDAIYGRDCQYTKMAEENRKEYIDLLWKDLQCFTKVMELYLLMVDSISSEYIKKIELFKKIKPEFVISFNYTHTYKRLYDSDNKCNYDYVHGEVESGKHNLVLGSCETLQEEEATSKTECVKFKKYWQRECNSTGNKFASYMKGKNEGWRVVVFGHSLGEIDYDLFRIILADKYISDIEIFYYDDEGHQNLITSMIKMLGKKMFNQYSLDNKLNFLNADSIASIPWIKD